MQSAAARKALFAACGLGLVLAFPPFFVIPAFFISGGWLYYHLFKDKSLTYCDCLTYFTAFFVGLLYWLVYPLTFDLKHHAILIPFACIAIPLFLGAQFAYTAWHLRKADIWNTAASRVLLFSFEMYLITYFIGEIFPNFPWMLPAYICCGHEIFMQTMRGGLYFTSWIILICTALCGEFIINFKSRKKKQAALYLSAMMIICIAVVTFGYFRLKEHPTKYTDFTARLIQCSIPQKDKENRQLTHFNFEKQKLQTLHEKDADFIIWPEAAVPYLFQENYIGLREKLAQVLHKNELLITGVVRREIESQNYYNSIVALNDSGDILALYDKSKLVPFGEYVPCRKLLSISALAASIEDFAIGNTPKIQKLKGLNVLFSDCYEAIFKHERGNADVMINLTNDGWFGHTTELFQHLAIVRARAVELGIPVIRVTNFGVSAVFDPCGRCIAEIPVDAAENVLVKIPQKIR